MKKTVLPLFALLASPVAGQDAAAVVTSPQAASAVVVPAPKTRQTTQQAAPVVVDTVVTAETAKLSDRSHIAPVPRPAPVVVNPVSPPPLAPPPPVPPPVVLQGILFGFDQTRLDDAAEADITRIASLLRQDPSLRAVVAGFTDDLGSTEYNLKLSRARANAVIVALVSEHGIAEGRLRAEAYGEASPVASNQTEAGREKNRRVEVRFLR